VQEGFRVGTDMGHCNSRFVTVIVYLMTLFNLDDDMETSDVTVRRIINLGRVCEDEVGRPNLL
jgi:hypothetical protein